MSRSTKGTPRVDTSSANLWQSRLHLSPWSNYFGLSGIVYSNSPARVMCYGWLENHWVAQGVYKIIHDR